MTDFELHADFSAIDVNGNLSVRLTADFRSLEDLTRVINIPEKYLAEIYRKGPLGRTQIDGLLYSQKFK
jgi:hypothetical protein